MSITQNECTRICVAPYESETDDINTTWVYEIAEETETERRIVGHFDFDDDTLKMFGWYTNKNVVEIILYKQSLYGQEVLSFKEGILHVVEEGRTMQLVASRYHCLNHFYTLCGSDSDVPLLMNM